MGKIQPDGRVAVISVIRGKTGRPISKYALMYMGEKVMLFANDTPEDCL